MKSSLDVYTLDTAALLATVEAAIAHDIDFLWLDCWAYRRQPPWASYSHDHFTASLTTVMQTVDLVLWLPRSRATASGTYQYRIWTTFEATVVALRGLDVVAVGYELSPTQRHIAFGGSFLLIPPWHPDDGSGVPTLGKVNFFFLWYLLSLLVSIVIGGTEFTESPDEMGSGEDTAHQDADDLGEAWQCARAQFNSLDWQGPR